MPHVFISYVHENRLEVARIIKHIEAAGIEVWLDQKDLIPGGRWQQEIRHAIESGSFFIACFSKEYLDKDRSYMNEELILAIDELRKRPHDRTWFVPLILTPCTVPPRPIGGGETLRDLQWLSLISDWDAGLARLIKAIQSASTTHFLRSPVLGIEFWQGSNQAPLIDVKPGIIQVPLKTTPFEMRFISPLIGDHVKIAASYNQHIFSFVNDGVSLDDVPFFRLGTGCADTLVGSGALWVYDDYCGHMYLDTFGRLLTNNDGNPAVLFNSVCEPDSEQCGMPKGKSVYLVVHTPFGDDRELTGWNFERFILSF